MNEIRKYLASLLLRLTFYTLPKGKFKNIFAVFLHNNIMNI